MSAVSVSVIISHNTAYVPVSARMANGPHVLIEPIQTAALTSESLSIALAAVYRLGHPAIPAITRAEWRHRRDPVLAATGFRSWKALAKAGAAYNIAWRDRLIVIYLSGVDTEGRFISGEGATVTLPLGTSFATIADVILQDYQRAAERR